MVATLAPDAAENVRGWCADIAGLVRSVGKRVPSGNLTCVCGFGSDAWDRLFGAPRPASLHPFREFGVEGRKAVSTRAISSCISAPSRWTCVSSWRPN